MVYQAQHLFRRCSFSVTASVRNLAEIIAVTSHHGVIMVYHPAWQKGRILGNFHLITPISPHLPPPTDTGFNKPFHASPGLRDDDNENEPPANVMQLFPLCLYFAVSHARR